MRQATRRSARPRTPSRASSAADTARRSRHHPQIKAPPTDQRAITRRHTMSTQTINVGVQGMTCGHCVRSVTEELTALPGVADVQVELVNGGTSKVTISATEPLADEDIQAAVEEAGYAIAPPRSLILSLIHI